MDASRNTLDRGVSDHLCQLLERGTAVGLSESQLLERFVASKDETAFAILVARHGPMVRGICRRYLSDPNDADDAFQATFLVLVRKAGSLRQKELLANWLHGVACRVAQRARLLSARQKSRFASGEQVDPPDSSANRGALPGRSHAASPDDLGPLIHEEVDRLPAKYRSPIVLCYFEGLTHDQAATRLGWPVGTVKGRLSRARDLLRPRLARRGAVASSAAVAAFLVGRELRAAVPDTLIRSTSAAAMSVIHRTAGRRLAETAVSITVERLTQGVLNAMFRAQTRSLIMPAVVVSGFIASGAFVSSRIEAQFAKTQRPAQSAPSSKPSDDVKKAGAQPGSASSSVDSRGGSATTAEGQRAPSGAPSAGTEAQPDGHMGMMMGFGVAPEDDPHAARILIARMAAKIAATDKNPRSLDTLKVLEEPVTLQFPTETPISDLLKRIKEVAKTSDGKPIPIYVDPIGLQEADKTPDSPVVIDLEDVPLKFALRLALKQLGLAYCVRDGVLIISSLNGIQQELQEALSEQMALYPEQFPMMSGMGEMMGGTGGGYGGMGRMMRGPGGAAGMR